MSDTRAAPFNGQRDDVAVARLADGAAADFLVFDPDEDPTVVDLSVDMLHLRPPAGGAR